MQLDAFSSIRPSDYLQTWSRLGGHIGVNLHIQRDDLLPAPLSGNKWVKFSGELRNIPIRNDVVVITNGGTGSNHCRTIALWGAREGVSTHMVLHGKSGSARGRDPDLGLLDRLGSRYDVVSPQEISNRIAYLKKTYESIGKTVRVISGGGHSIAGVRAYKQYAASVIAASEPDVIIHASGTGGTQGAIIAACSELGSAARVVGVSVARSESSGKKAISECLEWLGVHHAPIDFRDEYVEGGYGQYAERTEHAVRLAWQYGLPLDHVYTGKAFRALLDLVATKELEPTTRVLFWHTGGSYLAYTS